MPRLLLLVLLGLAGLPGSSYGQLSVDVFPDSIACAGDTIRIHFANRNLLPSDQVGVSLDGNQLPIVLRDDAADEVYVLTAADTANLVNKALLVSYTRFSNTTFWADTYSLIGNASVVYPLEEYCREAGDSARPVVQNGPLSFFFFGFSNTTLDPSSGYVALDPPAFGPQYISWQQIGCPGVTGSDTFDIELPAPISLSYAKNTVCKGSDVSVNLTSPSSWQPTDSFVVSAINGPPGGLYLDSLKNIIADSCQTGVYRVIFIPLNACSPPDSVTITVSETPNANFSYPQSTYCVQDSIAHPAVQQVGGAFIGGINNGSQFQTVVNPTTGELNLLGSYALNSTGPWAVTYRFSGACVGEQSIFLQLENYSSDFQLPGQACKSSSAWVQAGQITGRGTFFVKDSAGAVLFTIPQPNLAAATVNLFQPNSVPVGTYEVVYELDSATMPCYSTTSHSVNVNGVNSSPYAYPNSNLCQLDSVADAVLVGAQVPGVFTAVPAGLAIDSTTGTIQPDSSQPGTYSVFYATEVLGCTDNSLAGTVTVEPPLFYPLQYAQAHACQDGGGVVSLTSPQAAASLGSLTVVGLNAPASGLLFTANGDVDVAASDTGRYEIVFTPNGGCVVRDTVDFYVTESESPYFEYDAALYCLVEQTALPSLVPVRGGTFSGGTPASPNANVVIVDSTGEVVLDQTFAQIQPSNSFFVTYSLGGLCPSDTSVQLSLTEVDANFLLDATACISSGGWVEANGIKGPGSFYVFDENNVCIDTLSNASGAANMDVLPLGSLVAGTYVVRYELDSLVAPCFHSVDKSILVYGETESGYSYSMDSLCQLDGPLQPQRAQAYLGGDFRSLPGLDIDVATGEIDPGVGNSLPGSYPVYFGTTNNGCRDSLLLDTIKIEPFVPTQVTYPAQTFCSNASSNPVPSLLSPAGGQFSASPGMLVDANTGEIFLDQMSHPVGDISYAITYTPASDSCSPSVSIPVMVRRFDVNFQYNVSTVCDEDTILSVLGFASSSNVQGGNYFGSPSFSPFLAINSSNGNINPKNSDPGTFVVSYAVSDPVCQDTFDAQGTLSIYASPSPAFTIESPACINLPALGPDSGFFLGGSFSAVISDTTQADSIAINPQSGLVDLGHTTPGEYEVSYDLSNAGCPVSHTQFLEVRDTFRSEFRYLQDTFCTTDGVIIPQLTGIASGQFEVVYAEGSIDLDTLNGQIDLPNTDSGRYVVQHISSGLCALPYNDTLNVLIDNSEDFQYERLSYCDREDTALVNPSISQHYYGFYECSNPGLVLDDTSGTVDLLSSQPGSYIVSFAPRGQIFCPDKWTTSINIRGYNDSISFSYPQDSFCRGGGIAKAILEGDSTGRFTTLQNVVWANQDSGYIDLDHSNMLAGQYIIRYKLETVCGEEVFDTIYVKEYDDAFFSYEKAVFCNNEDAIFPDSIATAGGIFSTFFPDLNLNSSTGRILFKPSNSGLCEIFYTTNAECTSTTSVSFDILESPDSITTNIGDSSDVTFEPSSMVICDGETFTIKAKPGSQFALSLRENGAPGFVSEAEFSNSFVYSDSSWKDSTEIKIVETTSGQCSDELNRMLRVNPRPSLTVSDESFDELDSGDRLVIESREPVALNLKSDLNSVRIPYSIALNRVSMEDTTAGIIAGDSAGIANLFESTFFLDDSTRGLGSATVSIGTVAKGCVGDSAEITFVLTPPEVRVFIPEVFTPNNDGFNDTWGITWLEDVAPEDYSMELYARDMGLVLRMKPLRSDWDAQDLPEGVYWWILRDKQSQAAAKGGLTIRR